MFRGLRFLTRAQGLSQSEELRLTPAEVCLKDHGPW